MLSANEKSQINLHEVANQAKESGDRTALDACIRLIKAKKTHSKRDEGDWQIVSAFIKGFDVSKAEAMAKAQGIKTEPKKAAKSKSRGKRTKINGKSRCAIFREQLRRRGFDHAHTIAEELGLSKRTMYVQSWKVRKEMEANA